MGIASGKEPGKDFEVVSFSIFHIVFVICHCQNRSERVMATTNDKRNMENERRLRLKILHSALKVGFELQADHPDSYQRQ
jgi:hypothetical protein